MTLRYLNQKRQLEGAMREAMECRLVLQGIAVKLDLALTAPAPGIVDRLLGRSPLVWDKGKRRRVDMLVREACDLAAVRLSHEVPFDVEEDS